MGQELTSPQSRSVVVPEIDWRNQTNKLRVDVNVEETFINDVPTYHIDGAMKLDVEPPTLWRQIVSFFFPEGETENPAPSG